ncbi:hypothetical protein BCR33DRAFT_693573 [Rhizoclosmatium globosum]|uniref:Homeobox domain-containing protein n=1 Tax=Rhizoclosmatium globosum TaxID=329046 RepID=A0A1Y2CZA3_9FUNG|nr:hypothetical protein BCR33DRAFT_693573 [Rhizoclosmatium globosum]|eukprot:ORY52330.1 hypothetical protein BCR33DRAFT_693573 [Rhizoclosmatium globosum]
MDAQQQQQQQHLTPSQFAYDLNLYSSFTQQSHSFPQSNLLPMNFFLTPSPNLSPLSTPLLMPYSASLHNQHINIPTMSLANTSMSSARTLFPNSSPESLHSNDQLSSPELLPENQVAKHTHHSTSSSRKQKKSRGGRAQSDGPQVISSATGTARFKATELELEYLYDSFAKNPFPTSEERQHIADSLGMEPRQVQFWFQNRRANVKKSGTVLSAPQKK